MDIFDSSTPWEFGKSVPPAVIPIFVAISCYALYEWITGRNAVPSHLKTLPGPRGLPFIGYLPFLGRFPYLTFTELGKTYGEIFQVPIGNRKAVILNSREVINEAHIHDISFAGRPDTPMLTAFANAGPSRFFLRTADKRWKFLRKTSIKALALFASARNSKLEKVVRDACDSMHSDFMDQKEKPVMPREIVFECVAGVIGTLNFGGQFDRTNPFLKKLVQVSEALPRALQVGAAADYLPFGNILFKRSITNFLKLTEPLVAVTEEQIESHQCNDEVTDIADALYKVAEELTDDELAEIGISRKAIRYISQDLFGAGFATIMESFRWLLNIMAVEQRVQATVQQELDAVIGPTNEPTLSDRSRLTYVEATVLEAFRFSSLIPLALPHATMNETELKGYYIPKGAIVLTNIWGVHHNPVIFPEPFAFKPERFIIPKSADETTGNGSSPSFAIDSALSQCVMPFNVGKRRCVGENLARQELFLMFALIMKKFSITPADGVKIDLHSGRPGFNRATLNYELVFKKRSY